MILILFIILVSLLIADLCNKKIEDTIPVCLFSLLIVLFGVALLGKSHHFLEGSIAVFLLVWACYFVKKKRPFLKLSVLKEKLFSPAFLLYIFIILLAYLAYSNHFITVWDDYHYNATFPKDMYYYGTMPTGIMSATFYKSYLPLMQLFFYLGFQWQGAFSEHLMFFYKAVLVYTCMLPLMKNINEGKFIKRVFSAVLAAVLPYAFMFEMIESLSMDSFMAGLFGYALIKVLFNENKDMFSYVEIAVSLCALTLVKQIAPVFTCIVLGTWFVYETALYISRKKVITPKSGALYLKNIVMMVVTAFVCGAGYFAWKIFCNIKGNTVYLSGKLMESVAGGGFLPEYGQDTIISFLKSIFTLNLNLSQNGLTLFLVVLIVSVGMFVLCRNKAVRVGFVVTLLGLVGYLAVLLYTYIFVFEQWEAESLSSIDRYFGTYALAFMMMFVYVTGCDRFKSDKTADDKKVESKSVAADVILPVVMIIVLVTLPWETMINELIPSNYMVTKASEYKDYTEAKEEVDMVQAEDLETRVVMFVSNEGNSIYSRSSEYHLLPHIPVELEVYEDMGDVSDYLLERCRDKDVYYVYFSGRLIDDKVSAGQVAKALDSGEELKRGVMYYYDKDANIIRMLKQN